ncbi:LysR family transcriptional regulator [Vibrio breoganii]|uniref:LysR family transcriptional regulator n=1 Tax=Vibrio breoganii TaxID=553239 RepID=UPI0021C45835|nr:LysR family transcriptional regulator [Vibrio breoganii]MDN3715762.1 LysR family transcriptional regulator [Vibrio breoganii]
MYSFEQLKVFIAVCETGSFSAAARSLKRAQSGVSQSIANLEISIDQDLFNRERNTPQLTESGKALLPIAKSIMHQQKHFDQKVEALTKDYEHDIAIAVDESLLGDQLLALFTPLSQQFPITHFEFISASSFKVEELVRQGRAQIGIVYGDGELKVDMDFFLLGHARFLTVASKEHELSKMNVVRDSDLKRYRQCVYRNTEKKELPFTYGISTNTWFTNNHQTLVEMVGQGIGWANIPESALKVALRQEKLVALPVAHERDGWLNSVGCFVSRSHQKGPVLTQIIALLEHQKYELCDWK